MNWKGHLHFNGCLPLTAWRLPRTSNERGLGVVSSQTGQGRGIHQQDAPSGPRVASHRLASARVWRLRRTFPPMLEMMTQEDVGAQSLKRNTWMSVRGGAAQQWRKLRHTHRDHHPWWPREAARMLESCSHGGPWGQTLTAPPASLSIAATAFLRAWEHILTMSGLQRLHFLTSGCLLVFTAWQWRTLFLQMEICNLDFGSETHINNQIETMEGHLLTPLHCKLELWDYM